MKKTFTIIGLILFGYAVFSIVRASAIAFTAGEPTPSTIKVEQVKTQSTLEAVNADGTEIEQTYNPQQ